MVLDCSGRAGIVARRGFRRTDASLPHARHCRRVGVHELAGRGIDAHRRSKAIDDGLGMVSAAVADTPPVHGDDRPEERQRRAKRCASQRGAAAGLHARARPGGRARGHGSKARVRSRVRGERMRPCTMRRRAADRGILLVGDAASFIEPLSSAGVKKAMTSGLARGGRREHLPLEFDDDLACAQVLRGSRARHLQRVPGARGRLLQRCGRSSRNPVLAVARRRWLPARKKAIAPTSPRRTTGFADRRAFGCGNRRRSSSRRRRISKGAKLSSAMRSCCRALPAAALCRRRESAGARQARGRLRRSAGASSPLIMRTSVRCRSTVCSRDCRCSSRATRSYSRTLAHET